MSLTLIFTHLLIIVHVLGTCYKDLSSATRERGVKGSYQLIAFRTGGNLT